MRNLLILTMLVAAPLGAREAPAPTPGQTAAQTARQTTSQNDCRAAAARRVQAPPRIGARPLNQLPDAELYRAVDYREGGCSKPVLISRSTRR